MSKKISFVVPIYNEVDAFDGFYRKVILPDLAKFVYDYTLIFVADGS